MMPRLTTLTRRLANSAVVWATLATILRGAGVVIVMGYALRKLPANDIGLWYVMTTIVGWAAIVEFGFSVTIGRFASYYLSGASAVPSVGLAVQPATGTANYRALVGLIDFARSLYLRFGMALVVLALLSGWIWFLVKRVPVELPAAHLIAFVILSIGSGINMAGLFWTGILFGLNRVKVYNQLLVLGLTLNYVVAYGGLVAGLGLGALVAGQLILNFAPRYLACVKVKAALPAGRGEVSMAIGWRDLWPMTWRSGLASFASYLYLQGTIIFCSLVTDEKTTASYGLTLQLAIMLHAFSANWLAVKYPELNFLRTRGALHELRSLVKKRMGLALATYATGAAVLVSSLPWILPWIRSQTPLLPMAQMIALFGLVGLDLVIGMHVAVIQSGNEVPYLSAFVVSAALTVLFVAVPWWAGCAPGVWGVILAPFAAQLVLNYWRTPWMCWRSLSLPAAQPVAT